jgi:hypothetical protein
MPGGVVFHATNLLIPFSEPGVIKVTRDLSFGRLSLRDDLDRAVIVAVVAVGVMQPTVHQVVHVIAMRHGGMATVGAVNVSVLVCFGERTAAVGIGLVHGQNMLIHVVFVGMVQVAVVKVIDVVVMTNGGMPATRPVLMRMRPLVDAMFRFLTCHGKISGKGRREKKPCLIVPQPSRFTQKK